MADEVPEISEDEQTAVKSMFDQYDKDGSGAIDSNELVNLLRALGDNPTTEDVNTLMELGDQDESKTLDLAEVTRLYAKRALPSLEDRIATLVGYFVHFDKSGDNKLNKDELKELFCRQGAEQLSEEEVDELLAEVDTDNDGFVSIEEFARRLCSPQD